MIDKLIISIVGGVIVAGATIVAAWPKPLYFYQSFISREKCHLVELEIGGGHYDHTYCYDYLRRDCGLKHLDINGQEHFSLMQAKQCDESGYEVIAVRAGDKYKVRYSLTKNEVDGSFIFKSNLHPNAKSTVTEVRLFVSTDK